jgi:hypothetical protein
MTLPEGTLLVSGAVPVGPTGALEVAFSEGAGGRPKVPIAPAVLLLEGGVYPDGEKVKRGAVPVEEMPVGPATLLLADGRGGMPEEPIGPVVLPLGAGE